MVARAELDESLLSPAERVDRRRTNLAACEAKAAKLEGKSKTKRGQSSSVRAQEIAALADAQGALSRARKHIVDDNGALFGAYIQQALRHIDKGLGVRRTAANKKNSKSKRPTAVSQTRARVVAMMKRKRRKGVTFEELIAAWLLGEEDGLVLKHRKRKIEKPYLIQDEKPSTTPGQDWRTSLNNLKTTVWTEARPEVKLK
jgi:hypothetical protein